jgi:hypothetical protein
MLNIGELGNIATCEYPWRTLYLQHPERPPNTRDGNTNLDIPQRRSQSVDYVLLDLFRAGGNITRNGAMNINTQMQYLPPTGTLTSSPLESMFVGVPVGPAWPGATATPQVITQAASALPSPSPADRMSTTENRVAQIMTTPPPSSGSTGSGPQLYRIGSVSKKRNAINTPPNPETPTPDNNPPRPYFQIGELAPTLSRLVSASEASDTNSSSSTSKIVYSALRPNPTVVPAPTPNYRKDFEVEQAFREVSNSITTRGNVFRVLYVGQAVKSGIVQAEYLGEAYVERDAVFTQDSSNTDIVRTTDSTYKIIANRVVTE